MKSSDPSKLRFVPVSVIIPCYLCIGTIDRAVESIEAQDNLPREVILVDDASPDDGLTLRHLYWLREKYKERLNIKVIAQVSNGGAGTARNAGWEEASQAYISFLDADDTWHPYKLRLQYEYMQNNPDVDLSGNLCLWLKSQKIAQNKLPSLCLGHQVTGTQLLFKNYFSTPSVMLKRAITLRFMEGRRYSEDWMLWQQMAFSGLVLRHLNGALAYVHKPLYGVSGLSSRMWLMEVGELDNFFILYRSKKISFPMMMLAASFSLLKYVRRLVIHSLATVVAVCK